MNLFGAKKAAPRPDVLGSIKLLKEAADSLEKRGKHLEKKCLGLVDDARGKLKAGDKRGAMFQLKLKKMYEKEMGGVDSKRFNIETQLIALESAASSANVIGAMIAGNEALRAVNAENNIDKIDEAMDDIQDNIQMVTDASEALGRDLVPIDQSDLDEELASLEAQMADETLLQLEPIQVPSRTVAAKPAAVPAVSAVDQLRDAPAVPVAKPAVEKTKRQLQEEKEMEDLKAGLDLA